MDPGSESASAASEPREDALLEALERIDPRTAEYLRTLSAPGSPMHANAPDDLGAEHHERGV